MKSIGEQRAEELGLKARNFLDLYGPDLFYMAGDIHALLELAKPAQTANILEDRWVVDISVYGATHSGLLVGIRPIKEPTAEDLLRELVAAHDLAGIIEYKAMQSALPRLPLDPLQRAKEWLKGRGK